MNNNRSIYIFLEKSISQRDHQVKDGPIAVRDAEAKRASTIFEISGGLFAKNLHSF